jgi:1-acyl-sn-glycerol-3-phosphate acyltransferase
MGGVTETTWLRRLITIPTVLVLFALVSLLLPVLLVAALLVDLVRGVVSAKPAMATRLLVFLWAYLLGEVWAIVALGLVGLLGRARSKQATYRLQTAWASWTFTTMRWVFGLTFVVEGTESIPPPPILLLSRHASLVDTLLPARFVAREHGIQLRYVLKRELLVDPALDIAGNRLPNYFVHRATGAGEAETAAIRMLAEGMSSAEGVMIYPEGTRFSEEKLARYIAPLVAKGGAVAELASHYESVLPPRPGGTLALLDSTEADVVVLAHRGLEGFARVKDVWRGGLVNARIDVKFWRVPRSEIPEGRGERMEWLYRLWSEIDTWVSESRPAG